MNPNNYDLNKPYTLLIWLHGGPYRQTSYGYHPFHSYGIYDSILELLRKDNTNIPKDASLTFLFETKKVIVIEP